MNLVFHALAGAAVAHALAWSGQSKQRYGKSIKVSPIKMLGASCVAIASHGLPDWMKHGYPVPSVIDIVIALGMSMAWVAAVRSPFRLLFGLCFAASFAPDVIDHALRMLNRALHAQLLPTPSHPIFPWHTPRWSGSMYPSARIPQGSGLVALEEGHNQAISLMNHLVVVLASGSVIVLSKSFRTRALKVYNNQPGSAVIVLSYARRR